MTDMPVCPVETSLLVVGEKWKILIIRELLDDTKRFNELKKSINNISDKVLSQKLKALEEDGIIKREVYAATPPRVEYSLTELGRGIEPVLCSLSEWGKAYQFANSNSITHN